MVRPDEISEGVWRAAMSAYHKTLRKSPETAWQTAIAAALNAWDGAERIVNHSPYQDGQTWPHLILELPTGDHQ